MQKIFLLKRISKYYYSGGGRLNQGGRLGMGRALAIAVLLSLQAAPAGPAMYWKLDEASGATATPADDAVGANDGTHAGIPTPSTDRPPLTFTNPQSLSFDGVDDGVARASVTGIAAGNTAHTIAMWIKMSAWPATGRAWIALLGNEGAGAHHWLIDSTGLTQFGLWGGAPGAAQKSPVLPADGAWRHVAVTFDGTNISCYVAGTEVGTPIAATFGLAGVPFTLAQAHISENFFNGLLDDVRLYPRALTTAEVQYLAAGNGPPAAPQNLQAQGAILSIDLSWQAVPNSTYTLRRTTSLTDPNPPVIASGLTGLTYTDPGLTPGTTYYYVVTAVHSVGDESGFSNVASAIPLPIPPRTNDHEEGLLGDKCSCGSSVTSGAPGLLLAAALIGLAARSRRRRGSRRA
jgi:MYXO-CTERM domain-containing protein